MRFPLDECKIKLSSLQYKWHCRKQICTKELASFPGSTCVFPKCKKRWAVPFFALWKNTFFQSAKNAGQWSLGTRLLKSFNLLKYSEAALVPALPPQPDFGSDAFDDPQGMHTYY